MNELQKVVGAGAFVVLDNADSYDASIPTGDPDLPQIFELVILQEGIITTLEDQDGVDLLPLLGGLEIDAAIIKIPFPFKEGQYVAKCVSGGAKIVLYKVLQH